MKRLVSVLCLLLMIGCGKKEGGEGSGKGGKLAIQMNYHTAAGQKSAQVPDKLARVVSGDRYTQFGSYVTSITPSCIVAKFLDMRIQQWDANGTLWNKSINLIDNNTDLSDPGRVADFSKNGSVAFHPSLVNYETATATDFNIFVVVILFLYQEFELPAEYNSQILLDNLDYAYQNGVSFNNAYLIGARSGRSIKVVEAPLLKPLETQGTAHAYVFGATGSSFLFTSDGHPSINDPLGEGGFIVRGSNFDTVHMPAIPDESTATVTGTLSFDSTNLIQIYAGADNKPYTSDDIFVYAPEYWRRLSISIATP
ncbi:MAG: hypothetical protein LWW85_03535 [Marinilabiliales bacterium]|nr:hypothetical protein [Marinilabiliales bacterium]